MAERDDVYCTLVMNDAYLPGAVVLAHSLRDAGTKKKLACLIAPHGLSPSTVEKLQGLYNHVIAVEPIGNPIPANLYLMNRPDLLYTFTKIHLWQMTQFRKIVYIDADVVALRAPEELFDLPDDFAAAPDVGWPDAFNTGVMVLSPNVGDYNALRGLSAAGDSFDGADQGLLNQYFEYKPWKRLSFTYNTTPSANYQYEPAYRYFKRDISLVHFIGSNKPWQKERAVSGSFGAFSELLSRWWAVWDRHIPIPPSDYIQGQTREETAGPASNPGPKTVNFATQYPSVSTHARTAEQRRFPAPAMMEWDATRGAPPLDAKPEAANFPSQVYEFNTDVQPFRPPTSYPAPPKEMYYEVPAKPEAETKLKPLFPWEERENSKPTRRFVDDEPAPPEPDVSPEPSYADELEVGAEGLEPVTPTIKITHDAPWQDFGHNRNAWDEVSGIDDYVRQLTAFQKTRGNVQVVHARSPTGGVEQNILSPTTEADPVDLVDAVNRRGESLILTDFPNAIERPSLPVTPAPRRRPTFWGEERDGGGELPAAEGVPNQAQWDPNVQLEQLRRNSLIGPADLKLPEQKKLPQRRMPTTAAPIPETVLAQPHPPPSSPPMAGRVPEAGASLDGATSSEPEPETAAAVVA